MITTLVSGSSLRMMRAASRPFIRGMEISISTTSGRKRLRFFHGLEAVDCFAANLPLRAGGEQGTKSAADDFVVIDDEDVGGAQNFTGLYIHANLQAALTITPRDYDLQM